MTDVLGLMISLIIIAVEAGLLYIALKILVVLVREGIGALLEILSTSKKWIIGIAITLGVLFCSFHGVIGVSWFLFPSSLDINLYPTEHNAEIDLPISAIEGTYTETGTGYVMKPTLPVPLPVVPKIYIKKTDENHVSISGLNFIKTQDIQKIPVEDPSIKGPVFRSQVIKVSKYVPDKG